MSFSQPYWLILVLITHARMKKSAIME